MEVLVVGGHGQCGLRLLRLLARDGHRGRGVIRKAEQVGDLEAAGAEADGRLRRRRHVDGSARELGVARFVIVSSIGTHDVAGAAEVRRPYLQAKRDADHALRQSGLDWTIVKPGHLTDTPGRGRVQVSRTFGARGDVPRDDWPLGLSSGRRERPPTRSRLGTGGTVETSQTHWEPGS